MYYSFVSTLGAVPALYLSARMTGVREWTQIKEYRKSLLITGSLFGLSYGAYILALSSGSLAYVTALRNSSALLVGTFIGFWFLKEAFTKPKVIALVIILVGSIFLAVN